jgi:hypothetical protein
VINQKVKMKLWLQHMLNGQKVTKGQVLFTFYRDMSSDITSANAEIQQAQLAIQAYNSSEKSTSDQIELSKNQELLAQAQAKLAKLNKAQSRTVLAPISGTYFKDDAGRSYIYGAPVIEGNVNEYSLDKIKLGANVTIVKNDGTKVSGNYEQKMLFHIVLETFHTTISVSLLKINYHTVCMFKSKLNQMVTRFLPKRFGRRTQFIF